MKQSNVWRMPASSAPASNVLASNTLTSSTLALRTPEVAGSVSKALARAKPISVALVSVLLLAGCAQPISDRDLAALGELNVVAPQTAGMPSYVAKDARTHTECWLPSAHPLPPTGSSDTGWRVLCRVHWIEGATGKQRYLDVTCIGNFDGIPMLEACYRWAPYTGEARFEDSPTAQTR